MPDPSLAGAGIATVAAARDVVGTCPEADKALTAFVRWAQAGSAPRRQRVTLPDSAGLR
ncbi:hypothetical protein [Nonomuraea mesophila]|uniref:hypothetical protein n=1 Tax=Nonomuraea mesophila TaxID=2530382 RepID=UPI0015F2E010|nr:hypothetical protein [Nonomuraea mesophila]